ncbi:hypothetical protein BaRGS_00010140 [Batillaria attramentaria]|uniref:Uncharacterized protein n=1 Tax=Batillaria attramentaria TaxID=370345 RepID=A0ABD0LGD6_9CAEN
MHLLGSSGAMVQVNNRRPAKYTAKPLRPQTCLATSKNLLECPSIHFLARVFTSTLTHELATPRSVLFALRLAQQGSSCTCKTFFCAISLTRHNAINQRARAPAAAITDELGVSLLRIDDALVLRSRGEWGSKAVAMRGDLVNLGHNQHHLFAALRCTKGTGEGRGRSRIQCSGSVQKRRTLPISAPSAL